MNITHKPDCAVNELSYGVNPCTCGADKHTFVCAGSYTGNGKEYAQVTDMKPVMLRVPPELPMPAPTADEVRKAQKHIAFLNECLVPKEWREDINTILAALEQAQGEVERLKKELVEGRHEQA